VGLGLPAVGSMCVCGTTVYTWGSPAPKAGQTIRAAPRASRRLRQGLLHYIRMHADDMMLLLVLVLKIERP